MKDVAYLLSEEPGEERWLDVYFGHLRRALDARSETDFDALEREWRALYPIARADYHRFLAGWAKEHWRRDIRSQALTRAVLRSL
jgi:hypothetical protein